MNRQFRYITAVGPFLNIVFKTYKNLLSVYLHLRTIYQYN